MKIQSVRFGQYQWDLIARMAKAEGVSVSQYIRDAAYGRAIVHAVQNDRMSAGAIWLTLADAFMQHPEILARLEVLAPGTQHVDVPLEPPSREDPEPPTGPGTRT